MRRLPLFAAPAAMFLLIGAAPPVSGQGELEQAIFDLCPRIFRGELSLPVAGAVGEAGFTGTAPRQTEGGTVPRAERMAGTTKIVIAGKQADHPQCAVWSGGPDNGALLKAVRKAAKARGYDAGRRLALGDSTGITRLVKDGNEPRTLIIIEGDAGGEIGSGPATAFILMHEGTN
jgi:hypothetical protein